MLGLRVMAARALARAAAMLLAGGEEREAPEEEAEEEGEEDLAVYPVKYGAEARRMLAEGAEPVARPKPEPEAPLAGSLRARAAAARSR